MSSLKLIIALSIAFGSTCFGQNALADSCVSPSTAKYSAKTANLASFMAALDSTGSVRVIIGFKDKLDRMKILAKIPGKVIHRLDLINAIAAEVPIASIQQIAANPEVRSVEIDGRVTTLELPEAMKSVPAPQAQATPPGITRTGAPEVWAKTKGKGIVTAIIDTGIDASHPDLEGRVIGGKNFSSSDPNAWNDGHGHGTHVSGTVAATDNTIGVVGVAPEASLLGIKVLSDSGSGSYSDVVAGIDYAVTAKADVANMSLGGASDIQALHDAVIKAQQAGLLIAAAAGNSGGSSSNPLNYPGAYPEVVSVAAIDANDQRASFSTFNKFVALAARGVDVLSLSKGGTYATHSGTSMATPHTAGAAALLKAAYPDESVVDLKRRLVCNAQDLFPDGRDVWTGHGAVDLKKAMAEAAPETCDYLRGDVTEPGVPPPVKKPEPKPWCFTSVIYVKSTALSVVNDGQEKQLLVTVKLVNQKRRPMAGLKVTSKILEHSTGPLGTATAITDKNGEAQFVLTGFSCGRFLAQVTSVSTSIYSSQYGQPEAELELR